MHRVFVYGSLRKGLGNSYLLNNSKFISIARTINPFQMIDYGGFPGIVKNIEDMEPKTIVGEVYEVDDETLDNLDALESNGSFYQREIIFTTSGPAWMYITISHTRNIPLIKTSKDEYDWSIEKKEHRYA